MTDTPILCRLGLHRRTTIPRDVLNTAHAAGLRSLPAWYVGGRVAPWCLRCGDGPRGKTLEDLIAEVDRGND